MLLDVLWHVCIARFMIKVNLAVAIVPYRKKSNET